MRVPEKKLPVSVFLAAMMMIPVMARAEHTRVTNPSALSVEALGKGLAFSFQFDQVLSDDFSAGFGYGSVGLNTAAGTDTGLKTSLIPIYMHYYFTRDSGSFFGEAGATIVTGSQTANGLTAGTGSLNFGSGGVMPTIGLGYEQRMDTGFLFRGAAYGLLGRDYTPWVGFTFGYSF
jgi:hypothetical protein